MSDAQIFTDITATPTQPVGKILFTAGSTITINAPAERVFEVITDAARYSEWNSWCPKLDLGVSDTTGLVVGAKPTLHVHMAAQKRDYEIPLTILELERGQGEGAPSRLAWQGALIPLWLGKAERVQVVTPVAGSNGQRCELRQWESMSGVSAYGFKYLMGVDKQLDETNVQYVCDVRKRAEQMHSGALT